jgi:ATP-dependent RNA helicase DeaD
LQMAFDQSRPAWMGADYAQQEDPPIGGENSVKPILIKKRAKTVGPSTSVAPTFSGAPSAPVPQNS